MQRVGIDNDRRCGITPPLSPSVEPRLWSPALHSVFGERLPLPPSHRSLLPRLQTYRPADRRERGIRGGGGSLGSGERAGGRPAPSTELRARSVSVETATTARLPSLRAGLAIKPRVEVSRVAASPYCEYVAAGKLYKYTSPSNGCPRKLLRYLGIPRFFLSPSSFSSSCSPIFNHPWMKR